MARVPIPNFHNARLSVVQSFVREMICQKSAGTPQPGLCADHPTMRAIGATLLGIERHEFLGTRAAFAFYDTQFAAFRLESSAAGFPVDDCLELLAKYALAWAIGDKKWMRQIKSEFDKSQCDPGWIAAAVTWLEYYWDGKAPDYVMPTKDAPVPFPLPPPASAGEPLRVGILGDWGTGEEEALSVLDQLMQQKPDVIIHVGDIYYSGTHDECIKNFLQPIQNARDKYGQIPVYNLPGNHDYYSGGQGFYGILPQLNLKANHGGIQKHSFFCLQNDSWQLEGMDTGYHDHDLMKVADDTTRLRKAEADWHKRQLKAAGSRKVILFSHHQLYSAFATIGKKVGSAGPRYRNPHLLKNLKAWRPKGKPNIVAWLWGHEHLLEVYALPGAPNVDLPVLGRCVGNSAFPVFKDQGDYDRVTNEVPLEKAPQPPFHKDYVQTGAEDQIYKHGYVLLALGAESATATYYEVKDPGSVPDATSHLLWTESIPPKLQA